MESDQTNIEKTFEMINELTGFVSFLTIKVPYHTSTRQINISKAINDIHTNGFNLDRCLLFYLDNIKRLYVHIGTFPFPKHFQLLLKFQLFLETTIKLRFRKISNPNSPKNQKKPTAPSQKRKQPRKQKTILEVQELVSKWRNLYETTDAFGKKLCTLERGAQILGMQRKTLDDYFYKLKSAHSYGFDFEKFKHQKIGVLRQFVKERKKQKQQESVPPQAFNQWLNIKPSVGQEPCIMLGQAFGMGIASFAPCSYQMSYPPQKPPQDQIDKYFMNDEDGSSSESEQSD